MKPISAIIVGAGHRSLGYAAYAQKYPEELQIVGVADPNEYRRRQVADTYGLRPDQCYASAEELARLPKRAEAVINGTMDQQHVATSLPLLEIGYDILLEKPFATDETEMWRLVDAAHHFKRRVLICHVLRYTPFYSSIRQRVADGEIGDIVNIQTLEHVSYHHMAVCYVRGKWNRQDVTGASMLLAKCCHDIDLIAWMKSGIKPIRVASFGSNQLFRPEMAPHGAGTRCLLDCPIESTCVYSARKHYIETMDPRRWGSYTWADIEHLADASHGETDLPSLETQIESLKTDNPHGRCVWRCGNNLVDHQSVMVEFQDGSTATHNMVGGTARPLRSIHILGTRGEIQGVFEESRFAIRHIDPRADREFSEEWVDLNVSGDMSGAFGGHGGGDGRLVADFVKLLQGGEPSISCTSIADSVNGHRIVFSADRSMAEHRVIDYGLRNEDPAWPSLS